jgi:HAD superfamily hydrolase (TIGR01509 family)
MGERTVRAAPGPGVRATGAALARAEVMVRAVLLDLDGTLIDSNDAHARAWVDAFTEFGRSVAFERVRPLIGKGGDKLLAEVSGLDSEAGEGKRISERRAALFRERYLPAIKPFPGATALLERLRGDGLVLVVATSAKKDELEPLLAICDASRLVSGRTSSDDAENSKPDGDIVAAALARAGVGPADALMLGDTPYDIEAASRNDVGTVAVRSGGWDDVALAEARAVYADVSELLARYDDSPFKRAPGQR